jgi:hypothetical protein
MAESDDITIIFQNGTSQEFKGVTDLSIGDEIRFDHNGTHYVFKVSGIAGWSRPIVPPAPPA